METESSGQRNNTQAFAEGYDYSKSKRPKTRSPLDQTQKEGTKPAGLGATSFFIAFIAVSYQWYKLQDLYSIFSSEGILFKLGASLVVSSIFPSVLAFTSALILNIIGYYMNHRYVTLASIVLYGAALLITPSWGFLAIPSLALQIIAYGDMAEEHHGYVS